MKQQTESMITSALKFPFPAQMQLSTRIQEFVPTLLLVPYLHDYHLIEMILINQSHQEHYPSRSRNHISPFFDE